MLACDQGWEGEQTLAKLCLQTFIANIWYERNCRLFTSSLKSAQIVLDEISSRVRDGSLLLGPDTSPNIATTWDLPHVGSRPSRHSLAQRIGSWMLIITEQDFSIGILRSHDRRFTSVRAVKRGNPYSAAAKLIEYASLQSLHGMVLVYSKTIKEAFSHPSLSNWKLRFKARAAALVFRELNSHLLSFYDKEAKLWLQHALSFNTNLAAWIRS